MSEKELQEQFDAVYEDLYCELAKFGHLLELHVCILAFLTNDQWLNYLNV